MTPLSFAIRLGCVALGCCLATGCAAWNVEKPTAAFHSVQLTDVTSQGLTGDFHLNVDNPNPFSIPMTSADYRLAVAGVDVADGMAQSADKSIPAGGSVPVQVPVRLRFAELLQAERALETALRSSGDVPFQLEGNLIFSPARMPLAGPVRVPVGFSGTLPLRQAFQRVLTDPDFLANPDALRLARTVLGPEMLRAVPALDRALRDAGIQ